MYRHRTCRCGRPAADRAAVQPPVRAAPRKQRFCRSAQCAVADTADCRTRAETFEADHITAFVLGGECGDKAAVRRKRAFPVGIAAVKCHMCFDAVSGAERCITQRKIAEGAEAAAQITVRFNAKLCALTVLIDRGILQNRRSNDCAAAVQLADGLCKIPVAERQLYECKDCGAQHGEDGNRSAMPDGECRADQQHGERGKAQEG